MYINQLAHIFNTDWMYAVRAMNIIGLLVLIISVMTILNFEHLRYVSYVKGFLSREFEF